MSSDDIQSSPPAPPEKDQYVETIRDLPRMSQMTLQGKKGGEYTPPPPTMSRVGGVALGCGALLLTLLSLPMVLVAMWFGYYVWGPGLFLAGGVLLLFGVRGIWSGKRTALIVSLAVLLVLAVVAYFWSSFIPAAAALSPLGSLSVIYGPAMLLAGVALVAAFVSHLVTLYYWKRLTPFTPRGLGIWIAAGIVLLIMVIGFTITEQQQRESWLDDHLDTWTANAQTNSLNLGNNTNVTLGYSFLTTKDSEDPRFDVRIAELDSFLDAGAQVVRVGASGDIWLEQETPRLFADETDEDKQTSAERIDKQQSYEESYMQHILDSDAALYLSDSQYSPYMLVWSNEKDTEITWDQFVEMHTARIQKYASLYQPTYYEIVNEPSGYTKYSGITEPEDDQRLDAWVTHTEDLIAVVKEASPDTQIGVSVALQDDFDTDYYERVLALDGIDFIGFRVYQSAAFDAMEDLFSERGNPLEHSKTMWISETWYGYCLAPQRDMTLDADWLKVAVAFAAKEDMSGVISSDFGCFLQKGGTLFNDSASMDGRTSVWKTWRSLIQTWSP